MGSRDHPGGNLYNRFRRILQGGRQGENGNILFDDATVALYTRHDFKGLSALKRVLVKTLPDDPEPKDIARESSVVQAFRDAVRIQRVYAPNRDEREKLQKIMEEIQ